jgi:hypothetical protein
MLVLVMLRARPRRRVALLSAARCAVHPGEALRQGEERPGVPHQAADRRGPGHPRRGGGVSIWAEYPQAVNRRRLGIK